MTRDKVPALPLQHDDTNRDHSMAEVQALIEEGRARYDQHPFLASLDRATSVEDLRAFVPKMYFYVFAFQDMLRLSHERISTPHIREIAGRHRGEDAGHEAWFARDVVVLDCVRDVPWVFARHHEMTRDLGYALISEIFRATDDRVLLVMPLLLEAVGSTFFFRVNGLLERAGFKQPLQYFARSHQQVESDHEIFTEHGRAELSAITFDHAAWAEACGMVSRSFEYFTRYASELERQRLAESGSPSGPSGARP